MQTTVTQAVPTKIAIHQAVAETCRMALEENNENAKKMAQIIKQQTQSPSVNAVMDSILELKRQNQTNTTENLITAIQNKISAIAISEKDKTILNQAAQELQKNQQREFAEKLSHIIHKNIHANDQIETILLTANQYLQQHQYEKTLQMLEKIPQKQRPFHIWEMMAICATRIRNYQKMHLYAQNAAKANPGNPEFLAKWGTMELFLGNRENGFKLFESRKQINRKQYKTPVQSPMWNGAPFPSATLFIYQEHGIGDAIQFIRYLPTIRQYAQPNGKIILACKPKLKPLLDTLPKTYADHIIEFEHHQKAPEHHFHISIYSIPFVLDRNLKKIDIKKPYLNVQPNEINAPKKYKKIGIIWKSSTSDGPNKTIPQNKLKILQNAKNTQFFSLQYERDENYDIENQKEFNFIDTSLQPYNMNFLNLAQTIAALDGLITIDTAAAHIAGALFKPTALILPHLDLADWRWQKINYKKSIYPTITLISCEKIGEWETPLQKIVTQMNEKQFP